MTVNYKEISDKAYKLHTENKLEEAEKLYIKLLDISPQDVNILNLYGLLCISKGEYNKSINLLSKALVLNDSVYILSNLAKAYLSNKEIDNAIKLLEKALEKSQNDDIYYSLAIAYKCNNNFNKAIECYTKAIEINPKNFNACYNLSITYKDINQIKDAIKYANKCLIIKEDALEVYTLLSTLYELDNNIEDAIKSLEKAVYINPNDYLYYFNLGVLYSKINKIDKSTLNYLNVLKIKPNHAETLVNLCILYKDKDKNRAMEYILKAREIAPNEKNVLLNLAQLYRELYENNKSIEILNYLLTLNTSKHEAYSLLGINYMDMGEYELALESYNKALDISPNNTNYLHGKAVALKYLGKLNEAKSILEYILKIEPDAKQSKITLGMMLLTNKEFAKGMKLYKQRSEDTRFIEIFKDKYWNEGINIENKNILLYSNCGLGDTIMYSRYINNLYEITKNITLQTDKTLVSILSRNFPNITVIPKSKTPDIEYDTVISIMDLQYILGMDFNNIPHPEGYLKPDKNLIKYFSNLDIFNNNNKKIGLFWQGNKKIFKNRSISFDILSHILKLKNITWYSFQYENGVENIEGLYNLNNYIKNYDDTAALLYNIDLLITIDSSIAHMAGALGIKTLLLLPYTAEWRWFNDTKTTPWYNSIEIFRQTKINDWNSVINKVKEELLSYAY